MSAANYAACLAFVLRYEGGKVDDPRDPGGKTNQGITQRTYQAYLDRAGKTAVLEDVYDMTADQRDAIYRTQFWVPTKGDMLGAGADLAVFDFGVNSGPARALKAFAKRPSNDGAAIVKAVCADRLSFLHALGTFKAFGRGWTARVAACEALGIKMAENERVGAPPDAAPVSTTKARLTAEASVAKAKAAGRRNAAVGAPTVSTVTLGTTHASGAPWWSLAVFLVIGAALGAYFAWRASIHAQRSAALVRAALPPSPAKAS